MNQFSQDHRAGHPQRGHRGWRIAGSALALLVSVGAGVGVGATALDHQGSTAPLAVTPKGSGTSGHNRAYGSGSYGQPAGPGHTVTSQLPRATAGQEVGVVDISTVLGYQSAEAAGTGMVLTSTGEVLTNNHVVNGATSIKVTVVATGATYSAKVVGTDPTQDVAVIQLRSAAGLKTVRTDTAAAFTREKVTGVGNAGGVGGIPSAAAGQVAATDARITATDQDGSDPETLHSLIQVNADIQAGDSGGPLYNTSGQVIGMDTAAQTSSTAGTTTSGYAIPIGSALNVAGQIESGLANSTVHHGYPAFLGISLPNGQGTSRTPGVMVQQVLANGPAATVGLTAGDVITGIGSHPITDSASVQSTMAQYHPGQRVALTWTDQQGTSHSATVTLATGPAL